MAKATEKDVNAIANEATETKEKATKAKKEERPLYTLLKKYYDEKANKDEWKKFKDKADSMTDENIISLFIQAFNELELEVQVVKTFSIKKAKPQTSGEAKEAK